VQAIKKSQIPSALNLTDPDLPEEWEKYILKL